MTTGERHVASHAFNVAVLVVGAVALAWMVHSVGFDAMREVFTDVGLGFVLLLALDLVATCCDAAAIHAYLRPDAAQVSFWQVLAAQLAGRAINILTPGGALGEATKVTMLVGHAPHARVVSAIVAFNLVGYYLQLAMIAIGVPVLMMLVDLPLKLELVIWIGLAVFAGLIAAIALVVHRGALGTLVSAGRGLRLVSAARAARWKDRLTDIDRHLRELHADQSPGTRVGFVWLCASRVVSSIATVLVVHLVGVALTPALVVGMLSAGVLIGWISSIVPLGLGIADGTTYALFDVLGASGAHGMFVTMLSRARSVAMAVIGLLVMAAGHVGNRISIARRNRPPAAG